jgi:hypothetical protein
LQETVDDDYIRKKGGIGEDTRPVLSDEHRNVENLEGAGKPRGFVSYQSYRIGHPNATRASHARRISGGHDATSHACH